jgi:hypothetical protein
MSRFFDVWARRRVGLFLIASARLCPPIAAQIVYTPYTFTTLAGGQQGDADGSGSEARFNSPAGVAVDVGGLNVFVADTENHAIREINSAGFVSTLASNVGGAGPGGGSGLTGGGDGPTGVAVDIFEDVYFSTGNVIGKISSTGKVSTLAGEGEMGHLDGPANVGQFIFPAGVAVDGYLGNVYVADLGNDEIRQVTFGGEVTTLVGNPNLEAITNVHNTSECYGIAVDDFGNLYVADPAFHVIEKITPTIADQGIVWVVTILAGTSGVPGFADGAGAAAKFNQPHGIAVDGGGFNVYVADSGNGAIRKISSDGTVTTLAGGPNTADSDGAGALAGFAFPMGIALDPFGYLYVADTDSHKIRMGVPTSMITITAQPRGRTAAIGSEVTLSVTASGPGLVYQWQLNGSNIPGATGSTLTVPSFQSANAGKYTVVISNGTTSTTSSTALVIASGDGAPAAAATRLINISTRAQVGTGGNILIPGFVVGGSGVETLLIRADGPALAGFGVAGVLAQPSLSVFDSAGTVVASNTGWGTNVNPSAIASVSASVGAFALAAGSADCALVATFPAGAYTVQVSGVNNTTGVALAEVYEISSNGTRLANISTRAQVGAGANIIIPGFVISGSGSEALLARGDGPALTAFGVSGVLAQPSLSVFDSSGNAIASNTGWGTGSNPAQIASVGASVGAFALASGSADSALVVNVSAGAYTMQLSGVGNSTGVALAEVYEVP